MNVKVFLMFFSTGPVISLQESHPNAAEREKSLDSDIQDMIEITAYQPSSTVPKKPVSATSVPQKSVLHYGDPTFAYGDNRKPRDLFLSSKCLLYALV